MQQLWGFFSLLPMNWKEIVSIFLFCIYYLCLFLHWHIDVRTTTTDIWGLPTLTNPCLYSYLCSICSKNILEINLWGVQCVQWRIQGLFFKISCFCILCWIFTSGMSKRNSLPYGPYNTKCIFKSGEVLCKIINWDLCTLWGLCQLRVVSG